MEAWAHQYGRWRVMKKGHTGKFTSSRTIKERELEKENAQLWYDNMLLEAKVDEETALLWYEIMMGGS